MPDLPGSRILVQFHHGYQLLKEMGGLFVERDRLFQSPHFPTEGSKILKSDRIVLGISAIT